MGTMNERRASWALVEGMILSGNVEWFEREKQALRDARCDNFTLYGYFDAIKIELQTAVTALNNVLEEHSTLPDTLVDAHEAVGLDRFKGSRKDEFIVKLEPLQRRVRALRSHTTNMISQIESRITTIEGTMATITTLRANQQNDINTLESGHTLAQRTRNSMD